MPDRDQVERSTRNWLAQFVVGLNLCPFARPLLTSDQLRVAVCDADDSVAQLQAFLGELDLLQSVPESEIATTVLVFSSALEEFDAYLDFLAQAQGLLSEAGLEGLVQLASFHPRYQFAGEPAGAASHFSNRSPYPSIHLIREDMLSRVLADFPDPEAIPAHNIETLDEIGVDELERRWRALFN